MIRRKYPETELYAQNLSNEEIANPYLVIYELFDFDHLPYIRELHWEFFKATITGSFNSHLSKKEKCTLVLYHEKIGKLVEAAHIINNQYMQRRKLQFEDRTDLQQILNSKEKTPEQKIIDLIVKIAEPVRLFLVSASLDADKEMVLHDYLVVLPAESLPYEEIKTLIESACAKLGSVIVSFIKEAELIKLLDEGHIFYSMICKSTNLTYEKETSVSTIPVIKNPFGIIEKARSHFHDEFRKAESYLGGAKYYMRNNENNLAAHSLHQATEHTLRALLISLISYYPYGHNLSRMLRYSLRLTTELNEIFPQNTDKERELLLLLNKAYTHTRYRNDYVINDKDLNILLDRITLFQSTALKVLEERLNSFCLLAENS
ncbi:HEPN domain-containing protein [Chitinophaga sp. 22536]|uniref:HEPN domain-containing protein n=1 Tax=unclassified Chitinophaga TaxID=2619133 RepID=UPI003F86F897